MSGHDYGENFSGVKLAVDEWSSSLNMTPSVSGISFLVGKVS